MGGRAVKTFTVEQQQSGQRLDVFLSTVVPGASRAMARKACEQGAVLCNGKKARPGLLVEGGSSIELLESLVPATARSNLAEQQGGPLAHLSIIFEDEHLLAISKPRMMHSVTLKSSDPLTVADCLAAYSKEAAIASSDHREAGLVQRLDFYTSGLMLAAKSPVVWEELHRMLLHDQISKTYLALVEGEVRKQELTVAAPLADAADGKTVQVAEEGKPAESRVRLLAVFRKGGTLSSLMQVSGRGMRRHQVRAHLAYLGHPLLGDALYGSDHDSFVVRDKDNQLSGKGFYLHAERIALAHPHHGQQLELHDPAPAWLRAAELQ